MLIYLSQMVYPNPTLIFILIGHDFSESHLPLKQRCAQVAIAGPVYTLDNIQSKIGTHMKYKMGGAT